MPGGGSLTVAPNDATALVAWGQREPAANPQQLNRYTYVLNNPIKSGDPTGHCVFVLIDTAVCAAAAGAALTFVATAAVYLAFMAYDAYAATAQQGTGDTTQPDRVYEESPKHGAKPTVDSKGREVSPAPANGQGALDNSVQVKDTSPRRVGVDPDTGDYVVLDQTRASPGEGQPEVYHGHAVPWDKLRTEQQNALRRAGLADKKGDPQVGGKQ